MTLEKMTFAWDCARLMLGCSLLITIIIESWKN